MKLLILAQKIDLDDDVLGFFHRWVEEFSKHCEIVTVIALYVGKHNLPQSVRVFSLGKESGASRLKYLLNFYKYIWLERNNYDSVFVHMNQEYILLGAWLWKILGKKVSLWRNHYAGTILTRLAVMLSDVVFCTSKYSYTARFKKTKLMPVGIPTDIFKRDEKIPRAGKSILFLGRMSPPKRPDILIEALHTLKNMGVKFRADFYGNPLPKDEGYRQALKENVAKYGLSDSVRFYSGVPNSETPRIYNSHEIFVNLSPSGMYDKTIFEAMACETLVLTSNLNLREEIPEQFLFEENDTNNLAEKLIGLLSLDSVPKERYGKELREYAVSRHGLKTLAEKLFT